MIGVWKKKFVSLLSGSQLTVSHTETPPNLKKIPRGDKEMNKGQLDQVQLNDILIRY